MGSAMNKGAVRFAWRHLVNACCAAAIILCSSGGMVAQAQDGPIWSRGLHFQTACEVVPVAEDGLHDPNNSAVKIFQEPGESMANFPRDQAGIIDWVKVLENGSIDPRQSKLGDKDMYTADFDIFFKNTGLMSFVRFSHKLQTEWLTCAYCHPAIFLPQFGAIPFSLSAFIQGFYCGVCHGKVAFPPTMNCGRCHSVPRDSAGLR